MTVYMAFVDDRSQDAPLFLKGFGQTHDLGPKMLDNKFVDDSPHGIQMCR
jgi:hypothetical protein